MHMRWLSLLLLTGFVAGTQAQAAEPAWVDLLVGKNKEAWTSKADDWVLAQAVTVDEKNPKLLSAKPGEGILVNGEKGRSQDLLTKTKFGDVEVQLEFMMPKGSNSGLKFHGHYEIQLCDSFGKKDGLTGSDCGGVYPRAELKPTYRHIDKGIAPKVNACKEPGQWQTLEVIFLAPKFGADGKKTTAAKIVKATLNGQVIHENLELATPTGHNWVKPELKEGPLLLQGDHGPVAFRNMKVRPWAGK